jgi:predicted amidohydrolase
MPESLRVASVQMAISDSIDTNLERITRGIAEGKAAGARLVLFPETALSGFDKATVEELEWERLKEAEKAIARAAESHDIYVLFGSVTRSNEARPFNTAVLAGPDGKEITRYHKMVPEKHFAPGDHLALFEVDGIPCTVIICHDERFPELVRIPVLNGALVCFYISYEVNSPEAARRKKEGYRAQLIARAAENGIWVVQSNGIGGPPGSRNLSLGCSRIVDPGGVVITEAPELQDAMLVEDLHPAKARRGNALESLDMKPLEAWWRDGMGLLGSPMDGGRGNITR